MGFTIEELEARSTYYDSVFHSAKDRLEQAEREIREKNKGKDGLMNIFGERKHKRGEGNVE
jgi:hypothetical protein